MYQAVMQQGKRQNELVCITSLRGSSSSMLIPRRYTRRSRCGYESRTGTHNAYKEFRALKLTDAVNQLYQDMAGRSRAKSSAIQIMKTAELKPEECKRTTVKQMHSSTLKFPLPHRVVKTPKAYKTTFTSSRPNTYY
eukprot:scaffold122264_cov41-Tisochrysis_lutea.AAC.1